MTSNDSLVHQGCHRPWQMRRGRQSTAEYQVIHGPTGGVGQVKTLPSNQMISIIGSGWHLFLIRSRGHAWAMPSTSSTMILGSVPNGMDFWQEGCFDVGSLHHDFAVHLLHLSLLLGCGVAFGDTTSRANLKITGPALIHHQACQGGGC